MGSLDIIVYTAISFGVKNIRNIRKEGSASFMNLKNYKDMMLGISSAIFESFPISIISLDGNLLSINIRPGFTIDKIKQIALKHFYNQDTSKNASQFRLIHGTRFVQLIDDQTASDQNIKESDELILMEIRPVLTKDNFSEEALRGPDEQIILQLTRDMPLLNPPRPMPTIECTADFQNEIRKILITLVQASARILSNSPEAGKYYEIIKEKLKARCKPPSDPKAIKHLMDMGFSEKKVLKALCLRKMNTSDALEWLIEHQDDTDEDDFEFPPIDNELDTYAPGPSTAQASGSSTSTFGKKKSLKSYLDFFKGGNSERNLKSNQTAKKEPNLMHAVSLLLDSLHQYKKLEFKPNPRLAQYFKDMGFEENKVTEALKITGNHEYHACEWLLGERRPGLQDLDDGLDTDNPIYKAIISNPHIQLSLTNPKMLLAYLSILESPSATNMWINDPEASPILSQIFKTYHTEKHAIQMNRYEEK
ncbi:ubiquitin-associated domain-containing protein 1 isoform X2 [Cephus cinctus]|uniref:Ubiquitin-associated domain-containing protein 1 isoform X2 n=1 Tax=Cephus cinctus TaxID=211228 RepID=A0AAJ7CCP7_CEPCN|nr:ubiquitin-associated domain-containing protein 1 isoform X2 [Cephus cinctus]